MTFHSVTPDELQQLAFDHPGVLIHVGQHESDVTIGGVMYVARVERAA